MIVKRRDNLEKRKALWGKIHIHTTKFERFVYFLRYKSDTLQYYRFEKECCISILYVANKCMAFTNLKMMIDHDHIAYNKINSI